MEPLRFDSAGSKKSITLNETRVRRKRLDDFHTHRNNDCTYVEHHPKEKKRKKKKKFDGKRRKNHARKKTEQPIPC